MDLTLLPALGTHLSDEPKFCSIFLKNQIRCQYMVLTLIICWIYNKGMKAE